MKTHLWQRILIGCLVALATAAARADDEQNVIITLQSSASVPDKCAACQKLRTIGTARSVPALAALLGEERTSHAARYALEAIPCAEAGAALREAAGKTTGPVRAGLIDSLGWRRDREAVPLLAPLLTDPDATIAAAAASALGRIDGPAAVAALSAAREKAAPAVQAVLLESLLQGAERLRTSGDSAAAATLYRSLLVASFPAPIRAAAWRGVVLSDAGQRSELLTKGLVDTDRAIRTMALRLVRELADPQVIAACRAQWAALPADAQLAVLDADLKRGAAALETVLAADKSPHDVVRVAAWRALAELNAPATIPALTQAAAQGQPAERDAARETLGRMQGPGVGEALLAEVGKAEPSMKAELLRVLGERGDAAAVKTLLQGASADEEPVRAAAFESLRKLAAEDALGPLLDLARQPKTDADREPLLKALYAVCQASGHKDQATRRVLEAMQGTPAAQRRPLLVLLSALGTADALQVAQAAAKDQDPESAKEAVRALADWPNAAAAPQLLELARGSADVTLHTLAMRGFVRVAAQEPDPAQRVALVRQALTVARRVEEKRQTLAQLGQIPTKSALEAVLPQVSDAGLANEAAAAAVAIAEKLFESQPQLAADAAAKILDARPPAEVARRAAALRGKPRTGPFLRDWVVCGPYSQQGITGAEKLFTIAFGPEKEGEKVSWRPVPQGDTVDLMGLFPGKSDCVAYVRTQVTVPQDCDAQLLMGSDDGVKVWLNGAVVHSNNVDRPGVPDQDVAPIKLKKGENLLLLKITQGQGGWMACARIVDPHGAPIAGLRCEAKGDAVK